MIGFGFDGDTAVFPAKGFGPPWNGWLCPIVDATTLSAVINRLAHVSHDRTVNITFGPDGTATVTESDPSEPLSIYEIPPDAAGNYQPATRCWEMIFDMDGYLAELNRFKVWSNFPPR